MENGNRKKTAIDSIVVGFALFSMFFGAGNVVFPPFLGLQSGESWISGFAFYFIADIGLAMLAVFAILFNHGTDGITRHIGKIPAELLMCAIILCIGPMLAIPRTAATTFEMSILPVTDSISGVVFSVAFFALILALSVKQSAVVDIVGKVLTPLLLIGLLALIVTGIVNPIGEVQSTGITGSEVAVTGIKSGYQTMDVLAAMAFGIIILGSASDKGYTEDKERTIMVGAAAGVAAILLFVVYFGLTYLGASAVSLYPSDIGRADLIISIVKQLLGTTGTVIFGIVVALACITTAIALVSSSASYFAKLFKGKVPYWALVSIICVFSAFAANLGLDRIVSVAAPILDIVYPPTLVLIVLSFFDKRIEDSVYTSAVVGALITSVLCTAYSAGAPFGFLEYLPLYGLGLGWLVPAALFGLIAFLCNRAAGALKSGVSA